MRPAAARDDDRVESPALGPQPGPLRQIELRRPLDARLLPWAQGGRGNVAIRARLDLDETDHPRRRPCDKIDLARMGSHATRKNAVEFTHQQNRRERFAAPAATFGVASRREMTVRLAHRALS